MSERRLPPCQCPISATFCRCPDLALCAGTGKVCPRDTTCKRPKTGWSLGHKRRFASKSPLQPAGCFALSPDGPSPAHRITV